MTKYSHDLEEISNDTKKSNHSSRFSRGKDESISKHSKRITKNKPIESQDEEQGESETHDNQAEESGEAELSEEATETKKNEVFSNIGDSI